MSEDSYSVFRYNNKRNLKKKWLILPGLVEAGVKYPEAGSGDIIQKASGVLCPWDICEYCHLFDSLQVQERVGNNSGSFSLFCSLLDHFG